MLKTDDQQMTTRTTGRIWDDSRTPYTDATLRSITWWIMPEPLSSPLYTMLESNIDKASPSENRLSMQVAM